MPAKPPISEEERLRLMWDRYRGGRPPTPEEREAEAAGFGEPIERPDPELNRRGIRMYVRYARKTHPTAIAALADLILWGEERRQREAAEAVRRGDAAWLPWADPDAPPPALTEDDIGRRPRYRPFTRRPRPAP
jgi:hypothetical protein